MANNIENTDLIVFKGKTSQTGVAFIKEFPNVVFTETDSTFDDIKGLLMESSIKAILPIWNSHVGEITLSKALSMIFDEHAKLHYLWPGKIVFECLTRQVHALNEKKIVSIGVVEDQCSAFLEKHEFVLTKVESTVDAYTRFKSDGSFSAVLCAPGANEDNYNVLCGDAANPINFTVFALLASPCSVDWDNENWGQLSDKVLPSNRVYTAIQMPYSFPFSDAQEELFDRLIDEANSINEIPKALFVAKHKEKSCRILIEADGEFAPAELLDDEGVDESIRIIPNVGFSSKDYSMRSNKILEDYTEFTSHDFVKHKGKNSCFYACHSLGIVTHGFEMDVTENIARQLIKRCFELLDQGIDATQEQKTLYDKHLLNYREKGIDFLEFTNIGL